MASVNKFQKVLVLALDWILYSVGATDNCRVTVTQPRFQEAEHSAHTALLTCAFSAHACSPSRPQVLWFRFFTDRHEDLCTPECTNRQKFEVHASSENHYSLQINNLTVNDSAIYFCGIAFADSGSPHSKQTGDGTVLTKTERHNTEELNSMIIISSLLLLYSITVFTIIIVYKLKRKLLSKSRNEEQRTENCKISSGRKVFRAIAQELQKQRYAERCQQPVSFYQYGNNIDTYTQIHFCIYIYIYTTIYIFAHICTFNNEASVKLVFCQEVPPSCSGL
ncbi:immunoglobulin superfamily member 6 isoform X2 [Numida meleagris]|uniref:immunoglobulin superfamily member 6 isoform X2 n=1 Tax=Numida meleagris TaxID=8996 RepID=UPI000B3E2BC7|nr:immunoglobulin superfamily member 6 isoform X2 [Numida meleagris]